MFASIIQIFWKDKFYFAIVVMNTLSYLRGLFHEFGINLLRQVVFGLKILFLQAVTPCSQSINANLKMNNVVFKS